MPTTPESSRKSLDILAQHFKVMRQCPVCDKEYTSEQIKLVTNEEGINVLHISCPHCQHAMMVLIGVTRFGVGLMGAMTDLNAVDVDRIEHEPALSTDTFLDAVELLASHSAEIVQAVTEKQLKS